jgi:hypothetical protein
VQENCSDFVVAHCDDIELGTDDLLKIVVLAAATIDPNIV